MQEYTHAYCAWKSIAADNCTWVRFKSYFKEAYLEREEIEHTDGAEGYGRANNVKHGDMEDAFMIFASATAARDAVFTEITTKNDNLFTQLRQQEDQM